jgi:hypothetical protein
MIKYSVDELQRMRSSIGTILGGNHKVAPSTIEDQLRTYMQNGTTADELESAARRALDPQAQYEQACQAYTVDPVTFGLPFSTPRKM